MRPRHLKLLGLLLVAACATTGVTTLVLREQGPDALVVRVANVRSDQGFVLVSVFDSADGFPNDVEKALRTARADAVASSTTVEVGAIEPGRYAVAVLHDENGNGEMETDWLGRPSEGWSVSNDARGSFGPPSFEDAAVELQKGRSTLTVHLTY